MLSHLTAENTPQMVNVTEKQATKRIARARAVVAVGEKILRLLDETGGKELHTAKGAVFQTAVIAGIMAAKKTGDLIPLCHPLPLGHCQIEITVSEAREIVIDCTASIIAKTGIEMEALTGASVAALTVYDMCKALSHDIVIREVKLMEKRGGKSDFVRE
ncbi:MAG: cyclic pyranopterin monophosphate synthase MoaC [Ignavibacteria bacterium]|nr:cyclic pyranopterin monophosphate synthase MoaC [Ignavibacteria bacterium]MBL7989837.1 cyclic pyranopterin monophosphate synthase MoaC [Candidatus Kapabacteria bacterium]